MFGPRNSEKTRFLVDLFSTTFRRKFYYIVLLCKTFIHNITYDCFGENDKDLLFLTPLQDQIDNWLKINSFLYEGTNTLIILTDCTASRDMKQRMDELVSLAFSARHRRISVWVLTKQMTSITKPFRENTTVLFYTPSAKDMKIIFENYLGELRNDKKKRTGSKA